MNKENIEKIKKIGVLSGLFLVLFLCISGIYFLSFWLKEDAYIHSAKDVLQKSPLCRNYKDIKISKGLVKSNNAPNFVNAIFRAKNEKEEFTIFFVTLTGKYGSYQGVFLFDAGKVVFCGIAGGADLQKSISYYGITDKMIEITKQKIQNTYPN